MGDSSINVQTSNVLDDYSFIRLNVSEMRENLLFRCVSGLGPSRNKTNNMIGNIYFKNASLTANENNCNRFVRATGASNIKQFPGVYNARVCENASNFTTSAEGIYTCRLMNSSMMYQSMRIGLYFRGRSKSCIL